MGNRLRRTIVAAVPNGFLAERYSPSRQRTVFGVGKHSSGRGEDPRLRIYYDTLRNFAPWRVQEVVFDEHGHDQFHWADVGPDGQAQAIPVAVEARLKLPGGEPALRPGARTPPPADHGPDEVV